MSVWFIRHDANLTVSVKDAPMTGNDGMVIFITEKRRSNFNHCFNGKLGFNKISVTEKIL
jgi:hypothetical protein